ncbi:MAG: mevalonate kinase [Liquorilactobacillus ghanensis]|uniref:mevalonate kinase n=1 Tax=Liquorilactobacillus ghanensis TaxID=399370 RepID=UPI0039EA5CAD
MASNKIIKSGLGQSHAKIILIGEHSVVYGKPSIALPLSAVKTTAHITSLATKQILIECRYFSGVLTAMPESMHGLQHLIKYILEQKLLTTKLTAGIKIKITSQLPEERGMGSSAAVAVAVTRALYDYFNQSLSQQELLKLVNIAEIDTHGNPSGLDAATSASSQPIWMIKGKQLITIPIKLDAWLLICDSGIKGKTGEAVASVKQRLHDYPEETQKLLTKLEKAALVARTQLENNNVTGLGKTFSAAQQALAALGVSSPRLDNLIKLSLHYGSLGSKLTGGGRGGCFICLMPTEAVAQKAAQLLKQAGAADYWIQPLSSKENL